MSNNGKYFLNRQLIDDYECQHNKKKCHYNRYCISCKKDICAWCKGHESHRLIILESIEPNQEKYEKYEKNILKMYKTGKEIKKNMKKLCKLKKISII